MPRKLHIAVQMDPLDKINIDRDTSFLLMLEAQERGYKLFHYTPDKLSFRNGEVLAHAHEVKVRRIKGDHYEIISEQLINLGEVDVVLMRQDPPFDMGYISAAYLLDVIAGHTLIVNNPLSVIETPEKLSALYFLDAMPPTLVSDEFDLLDNFLIEHKAIVLKPLFSFGGNGVVKIENKRELQKALKAHRKAFPKEPIMAQKFMEEIARGDKRVLIMDGKVVGGLGRVPQEKSIKANIAAGGSEALLELTDEEQKLSERVGEWLKEKGIFLAGIDIIDGMLIEINVTSPTGLQQANRLHDLQLEKQFWDGIEEHLARR